MGTTAGIEFVSTKLSPPPLPESMLHRRRLSKVLHEARQVTVVVAPAGFGKTTALADWALRPENAGRVAWFTVADIDDEPLRFWLHFVRAITDVEPNALETSRIELDHGTAPLGESFAGRLVNDLCTIERPVTLVIDDFENVSNPDVTDWLAYVLQAMPPTVRVVLASRHEPNLPLATWRATGRLCELRGDDLRFTDDEAETYLDPLIAGDLSDEELQIIIRKASGWIAGLYLAALGILRSSDVGAFVRMFGSKAGRVGDYLVSEVLSGLPSTMRNFLLETSILAHLVPEVCDALTQRQDSHLMLSALDKHGMFIVAPSISGTWSYHPLFREVLRSLLEQEAQPERMRQLHQRAAFSFRDLGNSAEALTHAVEAGELGLARELARTNAVSLLCSSPDRFQRLLALIAEAEQEPALDLRLLRIWTATVRADATVLELLLAEESLSPGLSLKPVAESALAYLRGDLSELEASVANPHRAVDAHLLAVAQGLLATAHDHYEVGALLLLESLRHGPGNVFSRITATSMLAWNRARAGKLSTAGAYASQALDEAGKHGIRWFHGARWAELAKAQVAFDRGQLADAFRHVMPITEARGIDTLAYVEAHLLAGRINWALGQPSAAAEHLAEAAAGPYGPVTGIPAVRVTLTQARLYLLGLDVELAEAWLPDWRTRVADGSGGPEERLVLARFLIETGSPDDARQVLQSENPDDERSVRFLIEAQMLHAIAASRAGDPAAAAFLEIGLAMAEAEGFAQLFRDDATSLVGVGRPGDVGVHAAVGQLHHALAEQRVPKTLPPDRATSSNRVDLLTDRETTVLRYLATRLTNQEIAGEMYVSVNTVKSHIKTIYRKLGVRNRSDAVSQMVKLRLV